MTWFRVDDGFYDHPKVDALFDQPETAALAVAVWTLAGAWSSRHLTDGAVPRRVLRRLLPGVAAAEGAEALVRVGLWEPRGDGWVFVDWAAWNPLRDEVEEKRAGSRERARRSNERKKAAAQKSADAPHVRDGYAASAAPRPVPTVPAPTRPDPNPTSESETHTPFDGPLTEGIMRDRHNFDGAQFAHEMTADRPEGTRPYGGRAELARIADMLNAHGLEVCRRVVADVKARIIRGDLEHEDWSKLWARDGEIFHIRLAELTKRGASRKTGDALAEDRRKAGEDLKRMEAEGEPDYDALADAAFERGDLSS